LRYIDLRNNFIIVENNNQSLNEILVKLDEYNLVVLHSLNYFNSKIVLKGQNKTEFLWLLWGGEIYNNPYLFSKSIYGELTFNEFFNKRLYSFKNKLRPYYYLIRHQEFDVDSLIKKAAKKVSALGILHREEYDFFLKKNIINKRIIYNKFTYYPLEFIFKDNMNEYVNGNNIMLGNSASATNNHLEAFELLRQFELNNLKIITPLSYGNKDYTLKVLEYGREKLKGNFEPLTEFMELSRYIDILKQCGIVVMNHYRQQAVGNILSMIWMGAKVYLDERNTIYPYLNRIGCKVYSISEDLKPANDKAFELLPKEVIAKNRAILIKEIGADNIIDSLKSELTSL